MSEVHDRLGAAVGVDRLRPGDHAFMAYDDDEERWQVLGSFAQQGILRDEKVLLLVDVRHSPAHVAERLADSFPMVQRAVAVRQVVISNAPRFARGQFELDRLLEGARRRIDTVHAEGYRGLRSASEMSLALAPVDHLDQAVQYDTALHAEFFGERASSRFTALCYWDERIFGGTSAMAAVRAIHPVTLLSRAGLLGVTVTEAGISVTGDCDLATRPQFDRALRDLAARPLATPVLDITEISFLDASGADAVLRLAAELPASRRLEVRCRAAHRRLLHVLGASAVRQLSIVTVRL